MPDEAKAGGSVERVRAALLAAGHPDTIIRTPDGARTAAEAAHAVGCDVAQIVKSLIFRAAGAPVLVMASGANRVDLALLAALLGAAVDRPDAAWVRAETGFAIGGVAPLGFPAPPRAVLDADLLALDPIYAAAGAPDTLFRTSAASLRRLTGAEIAAIAARA